MAKSLSDEQRLNLFCVWLPASQAVCLCAFCARCPCFCVVATLQSSLGVHLYFCLGLNLYKAQTSYRLVERKTMPTWKSAPQGLLSQSLVEIFTFSWCFYLATIHTHIKKKKKKLEERNQLNETQLYPFKVHHMRDRVHIVEMGILRNNDIHSNHFCQLFYNDC